jgi:Putative peptidoglycan binding domain
MFMASRGSQRERDLDLDDWFAETDFLPQDPAHRRPPRPVAHEDDPTFADEQGADDWLGRRHEHDDAPFGGPAPLSLNNPRLWLALAAVAALVLIGLYVGGVFDGSKHPAASTPPTSAAQTPTTGSQTKTTPKVKKSNHVVLPTVALKPGDTGLQVKRLQRSLAAVGYSPGVADGRFGPATKRALERFQKAKKLTVDGILGPKTLAALTSAQH